MSNQNKTKQNKTKVNTDTKPVVDATKPPVVPVCIALLRTLAIDAAKLPEIPESMLKQRSKIVDSLNKLADRVHNGLGAEAKKVAKLAAKKVRSDAKTKRDEAKKDKKLAAIKVLKEKLAQMEADVAPVATDAK